MTAWDQTVDILVVGSGSGGLVAALAARAEGLETLLIEKSEYAGGTTAYSHGAIWLPNNPLMREAGLDDSVEDALSYMRSVVGDQGPATSHERQEAYVRGGESLVQFLRAEGVPLRLVTDYPDYYAETVGSRKAGRIVATPLLDARLLGAWQHLPRPRTPLPAGVVLDSIEQFRSLLAVGRSWAARLQVTRIALRSWAMRARGVVPLVLGQSYIGHLLVAAQKRKVAISTGTALRELVIEDGRVVGALLGQSGRPLRVRARLGVVLSAGGFARNLALRERSGPYPASTDWTAVIEGDTGDALLAATAVGAATSNLDAAYWLPGLKDANGKCAVFIAERALPHSIIVDSSGSRFANEAKSYMELGNDQYARHATVPAIPAYLILDARHRRRYALGDVLPGVPPRAWLKSGHLKKASSLRDLAIACGIDPDGLTTTVGRFNELARRGVDEDYGRGSNAYDLVYADPTHQPNASLGTIEEGPFYAAQMYPTDVGMAGGLLTNASAEVIGVDGRPIEGLYACGTTAASCMGDMYPGGGISIGQSSVFGLIAARHAASRVASRVEVGHA